MCNSRLSYCLFIIGLFGSSAYTQSTIDSTFTLDSIDIFYKSDKYELIDSQIAEIQDLIKSNPSEYVLYHIESFADSDGSTDYNYKLAERRGAEIEKAIADLNLNGIPVRKIIHGEVSFGDRKPNEKEKAFHRRSILKIVKKARYKNVNIKVLSRDSSGLEDTELNVFFSGIKQEFKVPPNNQIEMPLPIEQKVELHFISKDHFPVIKRLFLSGDIEPKEIKIPMKKMTLGSKMITTIQFKGGRSIILDWSYKELFSLASTLQKSKNICVELLGHIHNDSRFNLAGKSAANDDLSIARSVEVYDYLVRGGVSEDRLLARGYGHRYLLFPNAKNADEESKNRRVEVMVISCDTSSVVKNDYISEEDLKKFRSESNLGHNRKFNLEDLNSNVVKWNSKAKRDIMNQVKYLKEMGKDPEAYSYKELLMQYKVRSEQKAF